MNCRECDRDGDLMYSQSGAYATDTSVNTCITGICRSSVGRIIHDLPEPPTQRKTMRAIPLLMYSRVVSQHN